MCWGEKSVPLPGFLSVSLSPLLSFLFLFLPLPRIRRPSPGFLSPDPALRSAGAGESLSPWGALRSEGSSGPSSTSFGREAGPGTRRGGGWGGAPGPEPRNREPAPPPPQARGEGGKWEVCTEFHRRRQERSPPRRWGPGDTRSPGARPWGGHREGGCGGGAAGGHRHLGPVNSERHTTVPLSSCSPRQRLSPMRSGTAPRARPRPPDLTLPPAGPESLAHFSFSDEDTCWHPPGRPVRWVAWGQFPPLPLRALAGEGGRGWGG